MRYILTALLLTAGLAQAAPKARVLDIAVGTNTSGSASVALSGWVEAVYVGASDYASTGTVAVTYMPLADTNAINIATGSAVGHKVWMPRIDFTGVDGSALTSDPPGRFPLAGETLTFSISSSPTGIVWRAVVIIDE